MTFDMNESPRGTGAFDILKACVYKGLNGFGGVILFVFCGISRNYDNSE